MTLENTLIKSLSEWRPAERDTLRVTDAGSPWTVALTADHCELLGARIWDVAINRAVSVSDMTLTAWAKRIAAKTTGLPEPLAVLEVDDLSGKALLRSRAPAPQDGKVLYYEVLLKGTTEATLRRYQANQEPGSRREQVAFVLTHETLARVVAGLTA